MTDENCVSMSIKQLACVIYYTYVKEENPLNRLKRVQYNSLKIYRQPDFGQDFSEYTVILFLIIRHVSGIKLFKLEWNKVSQLFLLRTTHARVHLAT